MKKYFKKFLSVLLIFSIFYTNVLAITPELEGSNKNNLNIQDEGIFKEGKLFAILLEKELSNNGKIFDLVKKYGKNIQRKFPYLHTKIFLIDKNEDQNSIFSKLEFLYFNGKKIGGNKKIFLDGFFAIGDIPIPDIQIDSGFETKKSFFPYTDFEEKFFIFDKKENTFIRQKEISNPKSEIFFGFLKNSEKQKQSILEEKFYENYFEKLNNFYLEGDQEPEGGKNFDENKIFFADLNKEKQSVNQTLLSQYEKSQNYQYEISYQKYSSDFADKLRNNLIKDISEPRCAKYKAEGEAVEKVHCVTPNTERLSEKISNSNLIGKFQVEKLLPEYRKVVNGFIQKSNDLIFKSGENKKNLQVIPKEIFIKDFLTRNYIKTVNQLFEEKIIKNLKSYVDSINKKVENLQNTCSNNCDNIPGKITLEINNSPTPKTIKEAINAMNMDLKVDIKNNIYFKDDWNEFDFYLPNLFFAHGDLNKYTKAYLSYANNYINKFSNTEFKLEHIYYDTKNKDNSSADKFVRTKVEKRFLENFFDEIIFQSEDDFKYYSDWLEIKDINKKRKTILEKKVLNNSENFYLNKLENGENLDQIEKFSTFYFRSGIFGDGENFYIEDIEKNYDSEEKISENSSYLEGDGEILSGLEEKCGSYNGVPLPEWFDAIQCWIDDIKDFGETQQCGGGNSKTWDNFWNGEQFKNSLELNGLIKTETSDNFQKKINTSELKDYEFGGEKDYIKDGEKLYFTAEQKKVGIIKEGSYNSVLLNFFTINKEGEKIDFTGYTRLKFENGKNGLINNENLFFENGKATTGIISKEKNPILIIYGNGFQERKIKLNFSKSWLAKDLIEINSIPENVKKIDVNGTNFYSAFLFGNQYANLKNGIAYKLLESGKALSVASSINNFIFYNENYDYIKNYEKLKNGTEKNIFGIGFGDEEKSMMKFLSGDFIGNSVKSENGIFSVILGDPMISFKNKKNPNEFTKTIGKEIFKFSGDVDKIEIIDFNQDLQDDILVFMKDGFIKLFKGENGNFIKKGDLAFFSSNVEKVYTGDTDKDSDQDFIIKLYDGREYFFENKSNNGSSGKFSKILLKNSTIEKFLIGKVERFDIKKNILSEDDTKNKEYGKSDVQKILADNWGIDLNSLNTTEMNLNTEIGNINEKLLEAVNFISNLTCMGGSCISSPVNYAFLVPGKINVPGFVKEAITVPTGPVPGTPIFGIAVYPVCSGSPCPIPCTGLMCYGGVTQVYRHYISPTITGGLGYAYCVGPESNPTGTPLVPKCFITALPINALGICEQEDPFSDIVQTASQEFSKGSQAFKSGGKSGKNSLLSQMIGSGGIPDNEDGYIIGLDGTDVKIFDENNNTMAPFFSGFLSRWLDKQMEELSVNMLDFPTIKLILPDIKSGFESLQESYSGTSLVDNEDIFNFGENWEEEKNKLKKSQEELENKKNNNKSDYFSKIEINNENLGKNKDDIFSEESFERGSLKISSTSKTIEESYNKIFQEIENLPILQIRREKITLDIPWINPYKLNSLIIELDDFITRHENILKDIPKDQFIYIRNYINTLKGNLEVLKTYRDFPQEIMKYRFFLSKYIGEIISMVDCVTDYIGGWIIRNKKIVIAYIKLYYFIKNVVKAIQKLSLVFQDYKQSCQACKANTGLSNFSLAKIFMSLIPEPPIVKMPKLPDVKMDLSDIQLGISFTIPEINFRVKEIHVPSLNLPTIAFGHLNLPMFTLPPAPKLPSLPELPSIDIPKLPDLPPPPKLPEFPSFIIDLTETIRLILKLYCLIFEEGLFVYSENEIKQVVEGLTNRSTLNFLPFDMSFLQFPNLSFSTIKEIQINTLLDIHFDDKTIYKKLEEKSKSLNSIHGKLQENLDHTIGTFNEESSKIGIDINKETKNIFNGVNEKTAMEK